MDPRNASSPTADSLWHSIQEEFPIIDTNERAREHSLNQAADLHKELLDRQASSSLDQWRRLANLYRDTLSVIHNEVRHLEIAHHNLGLLVNTLESSVPKTPLASASTLNLSQKRNSQEFKRFKNRFPTISFGKGSNVSVRTTVEGQDAWIWAIVRNVHGDHVEVEDVEDKNTFMVTENDVIPLPPDDFPDFPVGTTVLACYPETTAFYKGTVVSVPRKHHSIPLYHIQFDNDNEIPYHQIQKSHITMYVSDKVDRMRL